MREPFEYDVAFSFVAMDERIATALNDLLSSRLKTFIYSERQRDLGGKDGQEAFSSVYGKTARVVVVLFRPEWGETPWTRVERDAIKNRSLDEGWDFTVFVPTVERPKMPPWIPKARLYVDLIRWGVQSAAAVIEARAVERGSTPRVETVVERAERFARAKELEARQRQFERSEGGVKAARDAYEQFSQAIEERVAKITSAAVPIRSKRAQHYRILAGLDPCNAIYSFEPFYANSLDDVYLHAQIYKGFPRLPGFIPSHFKATKVHSKRYAYRLVRLDHPTWVGIDEDGREFSPQQLADHVLREYIDRAQRTKID